MANTKEASNVAVETFDAVEMQFYKDAYIALCARLIDPELAGKFNLAGEPYWQSRIDLADTIAMEMTGTFKITRDIHSTEFEE